MLVSKILLYLVFVDYTVTMVQLLVAKILPLFYYKEVPVYFRWMPGLGFIYSINEPFDVHENPMYYFTVSSAKRAIDMQCYNEVTSRYRLFINIASKLKITKRLR
jgi:hypothetical protein